MKSKLAACITLFTLYTLHFTLFADVPQVLTYRGVLQRTGGYERPTSLALTFRLYDSKSPDTALWCRSIRTACSTPS